MYLTVEKVWQKYSSKNTASNCKIAEEGISIRENG
jgi:hypothetical protein